MTNSAVPASHDALAPSPWIVRYAHLVPSGARVLDLACGSGRHARLFAGRGARVLAVDRDPVVLAAIDGLPGIETRVADLEGEVWPLAGERFDAIVVTKYLYRPRLAAIVAAINADGVLLYETFACGNEAFGRPSNPDFLLERDELLDLARGRLTVVAFAQGRVDEGGRSTVVQRLAAVGPRRAWPSRLIPDTAGGVLAAGRPAPASVE